MRLKLVELTTLMEVGMADIPDASLRIGASGRLHAIVVPNHSLDSAPRTVVWVDALACKALGIESAHLAAAIAAVYDAMAGCDATEVHYAKEES